MSLHTDRAFHTARDKGAWAASNYQNWNTLVGMSKRELAEIALHLAAITTDSYETALETGDAFRRVMEERDALRNTGSI